MYRHNRPLRRLPTRNNQIVIAIVADLAAVLSVLEAEALLEPQVKDGLEQLDDIGILRQRSMHNQRRVIQDGPVSLKARLPKAGGRSRETLDFRKIIQI